MTKNELKIFETENEREKIYYPLPRRWIVADVPELHELVEPEEIGRFFAVNSVEGGKKHFLKT